MAGSNNIDYSQLSPVVTGTPARKISTGNNSMGKDQFLQILITQLKNQDPLSPLQDKDFIAQMAQFSSVEQMTNLSTTMTNSLKELQMIRGSLGITSGLIDKNITWTTPSADKLPDTISSGTVEAITIRNGLQYAIVNGEEVSLDKIIKIQN